MESVEKKASTTRGSSSAKTDNCKEEEEEEEEDFSVKADNCDAEKKLSKLLLFLPSSSLMLANLEEGPEERQPLHFPARGEGHHGREPKRMRCQQRAKRPDKIKVEIYLD